MNKNKLLLPVMVGLMVGQLFAESERPFSIANTLRFGYNDNLYYNANGAEKGTTFVADAIDLSFHAALSARTDLLAKSRINLLTDDGGNELYPNLYVMLNHAVSSRLLLRVSEYYTSGDRNGFDYASPGSRKRYNYYINEVRGSADYIIDQKNRLEISGGYKTFRNENDKSVTSNNFTTADAGVTWKHDIVPQRTYSTLNLRERKTEYDNRAASFYATDVSAGLGHTFNREWQGTVEGGASYVSPDVAGSQNDKTWNPLINAGLSYSPSPRTRLSADLSYQYQESVDSSRFGGGKTLNLLLAAQHDLTAKLMAKATFNYVNTKYDQNSATPGTPSQTDDLYIAGLRLTYKLNRINSIEAGYRYAARQRDPGTDWTQNMVDIGWRVELD